MSTWSDNPIYTKVERRLDGAIQVAATLLAIASSLWLLSHALNAAEEIGLTVYALGMVSMFASSLAYGVWRPGRMKELLRRLDHSVIFVMIAGTFTPFAALRHDHPWDTIELFVMWLAALVGILLKLIYPRRFENLGLVLCVAMGLAGLTMLAPLIKSFSPLDAHLFVAGIVTYLIGVVVLQLHRVRFHNALWHALVTTAAGLQFAGIAGIVLHYY